MTQITIVSGSLVAVKHGVVIAEIHSLTDFYRVEAAAEMYTGESVYCSSSVDFPEESTSRPDVIALCRQIRSL